MKNNTPIHIGSRSLINPSEIVILKADVNYTYVYLLDGSSIYSSTTIGILEKRLQHLNFYRTHRSTLINVDYIKWLERDPESEKALQIRVDFHSETKLIAVPVSRRKVKYFLSMIN